MRSVIYFLLIQCLSLTAYTQCGTTNISSGKTITASADPFGMKDNVKDGNASTEWHVSTTADQWIYVDLAQQYTACRFVVKWTMWSYMTSFKIQYSNTANNDWVDLVTVNSENPLTESSNAYQYHDKPITNPTVSARYYRLYLTGMTAYSIKIAEFEIYNQTGGGGGGTNGAEWYTTGNSGTTSSNFLGTTDDHALIFKTNGRERMNLHGTEVGGGGFTSTLKLVGDLNNNISLDFSAAGTAFHRITSNANGGTLDIIAGTGGGGHNIRFFTDQVERGKIDNLGKWQVGATTGVITLDPLLSRSNDRIRIGGNINPGDGQNIILSTSNDGGATYKRLIVERDGDFGLGNSNVTSGWGVGNPSLRFFDNGRVSIFTSLLYFGKENGPWNSSSLLTYVSDPSEWTTDDQYPSGNNFYYFGTILQSPKTAGAVRAPLLLGGRELRFVVGGLGTFNGQNAATLGVEGGRFSATGNLLLGTTTDNSNKLQVSGTTWTTGFILPTGAGAGKVLTSDASGNATWQVPTGGGGGGSAPWTPAGNGDFIIQTGSTPVERMRVAANGKVGIGVTNLSLTAYAGYRLIVEEGIKSKKVKVDVQTAWPDHVFHKSYELPTLEFVEKYIADNHHLPDVPSADDVAKEGLDLGDNQAVLLKKIEELTLYIIDQNKRIIEQQKQLDNQQKKINQLEKKIIK